VTGGGKDHGRRPLANTSTNLARAGTVCFQKKRAKKKKQGQAPLGLRGGLALQEDDREHERRSLGRRACVQKRKKVGEAANRGKAGLRHQDGPGLFQKGKKSGRGVGPGDLVEILLGNNRASQSEKGEGDCSQWRTLGETKVRTISTLERENVCRLVEDPVALAGEREEK